MCWNFVKKMSQKVLKMLEKYFLKHLEHVWKNSFFDPRGPLDPNVHCGASWNLKNTFFVEKNLRTCILNVFGNFHFFAKMVIFGHLVDDP